MLFNSLNRLAKAATVAALTAAVAFVAQPAQKASAQFILEGSGTTSIDIEWISIRRFRPVPHGIVKYERIGSALGRSQFEQGLTDFVATNITLPDVPGQVVINPVDTGVALPYNVPGFSGVLSASQVCGIIAGSITDWSEVGGPQLPIRRVYRADVSGSTTVIDTGFIQPVCGFSIANQIGAISELPNPNQNDIAVSSSSGVVEAITFIPGAISYVETSKAFQAGLPVAFLAETGQSQIPGGPLYVVFRGFYETAEKAAAARDLCFYLATEGSFIAQLEFGYAPPSDLRDPFVCNTITGPF